VQSGSQAVFNAVVTLPRWIRGEFHGDAQPGGGFEIDDHLIEPETTTFVVRVPDIPGASLVLGFAPTQIFNLQS
jgi:hypothetical protein